MAANSKLKTRILPPEHAPIFAEALTTLINDAFYAASGNLTRSGTEKRTTVEEIASAISRSEMIILYSPADDAGIVLGTARVYTLDSDTAGIGFLAVNLKEQGKGFGKLLVNAAERMGRVLGCEKMQLELLMPREEKHEAQAKTKAWYEKLGYVVTKVAKVEEFLPLLVPELKVECDYLVLQKGLQESV
jgi:GNAT superfamily N-acetyltransferase